MAPPSSVPQPGNDGRARAMHPARARAPRTFHGECVTPNCRGTLAPIDPAGAVCPACGLVVDVGGTYPVADAEGTRRELLAAAAACAGSDWSLSALLFGRTPTDAPHVERYQRLARAETGVATLARRRL